MNAISSHCTAGNSGFIIDLEANPCPYESELEANEAALEALNLLTNPRLDYLKAIAQTSDGQRQTTTLVATKKLQELHHLKSHQPTPEAEYPSETGERRSAYFVDDYEEALEAKARSSAAVDLPINVEADASRNPLDHSRPLDVHTWSDHPEANAFVDRIYENYFAGEGNQNHQIRKKHVKVVLLDLYVAWKIDPALKVAYSRNSNDYEAHSRYNALHISRLSINVVDRLIEAGLVEHAKGFKDRETGIGRISRMWPSDKLVTMFAEARFGPLDIRSHEEREVIVLRDDEGKDIAYDDNDYTAAMRQVVQAYNDLIRCTFVDIPMLEQSFIEWPANGTDRARRLHVNQRDKFTRRIFNRGLFDKGGRFWGGWWQRCPKEWRHGIFIDEKPVSELDYSGLHLVLMYANAGIDYWAEVGSDPYMLVDVPDEMGSYVTRDLCKKLLLVAINAVDETSTFQAFRDNAATGSLEKRLSNGQLSDVLNLLRDKHSAIGERFASDAGIDLMNQDSRITEQIISWFTSEEIPILTIHDSYLVPVGWETELDNQMHIAFAATTGVDSVRINVETHDPWQWEPLDESDRIDHREWEMAIKYRFDPPRTQRYQFEWDHFRRWVETYDTSVEQAGNGV